ncbi:hypothetical protein Leryth_003922 [Lithospermum erythrorhizon]|nr:hypothetical protein Leryth_003922 [Lithospermum erythrorhizon]
MRSRTRRSCCIKDHRRDLFMPSLSSLCYASSFFTSLLADPSQLEMAMFNGIKTTQNPIDNIDEIEPLMIKKGDILSIRSLGTCRN